MATPVLEMRNVEKNFGGVRAIDNFSVTLEPGKIHGLIGPNGAGKTTIFNNITGIYAPDSGKIIFNGTDITGSAPHRVAQLGIGRTFQNIRLFSNLSVLSNVVIASNLDATYNMADAIFKTKKYREREKHLEEKAMTCWRWWVLRTRPTSRPTLCPTATSGNWKSPEPWRWTPSCCFWTSRLRA